MVKAPPPPANDDMEIAPGHRVADWKSLQLGDASSADWAKAIGIFEARIRRRFVDPVDVLIAHEIGLDRGTFGFAILAIDCLLIETLQGFREGLADHTGQSKNLIKKFLSQRTEFVPYFHSENEALEFYDHYRCALLHSGQTGGDVRIQREGALIERSPSSRIDVNRTAFHEAVKHEFEHYLDELRAGLDTSLRRNLRAKMDAICA